MTPAELRQIVLARDKGCVWPGCDREIGWANPLQLAHLTHRGMGGGESRNTEDGAVMLCQIHHDCLDGRTGLGILRVELNGMLKAVVERGN